MKDFKIALLQLCSTPTQAGNLEKGLDYCRRAKAMGADLALFPEMWNNGYRVTVDPAQLEADAVPGTVRLSRPLQIWQRSWKWRLTSPFRAFQPHAAEHPLCF